MLRDSALATCLRLYQKVNRNLQNGFKPQPLHQPQYLAYVQNANLHSMAVSYQVTLLSSIESLSQQLSNAVTKNLNEMLLGKLHLL